MNEGFNNNCNMYNSILEEIGKMPVVDCHEHLMPEKNRIEGNLDIFSVMLSHYASSDLVSAGMPQDQMARLKGANDSFDEKAKIFMNFWSRTSNTSYCRALRIAIRDLYGIDEINIDTLPEINNRMIEMSKPGFYKQILQDKLNIKYCLWDQFWTDKPERDYFFKLSLRLDDIVYVNDIKDIKSLESKYKIKITTPANLDEIMEIRITEHKNRGLTAIKSGLAYIRSLDYEPVSLAEATLAMDKILRERYTAEDAKKLQDYLMYRLAEKAYWHNLPMQIHTGLLEGNGNDISNANPALLSHLIINNPNTRFDLFHGGYPFGGELSAMAKMFPNVYADLSWTHVISPVFSRRYLSEWLDTVPVCKILGFGGDYTFVEGVYGHLQIAKENIAHVLAEKVEDGVYSKAEALRYARMILFDNANELFG